jgi:2',3'-cyclic-nucleotide 2'-phosphodiesterase (5'-nucleotidase family)
MNLVRRVRLLVALFATLAAILVARADTAHLLILHTNDLHDHVRPGYNGHGGLPYIAGYIESVRATRKDVLLLDAGDVTEKGDMVAAKSGETLMWEMMRRIGYDAVTPGNHDEDAGRDGLRRYEKILGQPLLNLNLLRADGTPDFTPSRVVKIGAVRVGIIGMIVPRAEYCLDFEASGRALGREAERLKPDVDLVIALCHEGSRNCARWSKLAPAVDVFVSGHTHEALASPESVPETHAIIVQAGCYAEFVGRLELEVDLGAKKVVHSSGELVPMLHNRVPVDQAIADLVRQRERALCPEASEFVFENPAELDIYSIARLAAAGLQRAAKADVAFCHPAQILRDKIPAGRVDYNALFRTGDMRASPILLVELTGAEIETYVNALQFKQREPPEWAGFRITREHAADGAEHWRTDLEATRRYRVVMPKLEWDTRYLRFNARDAAAPHAPTPTVTSVTYTDALRASIQQALADGTTVEQRAAQLAALREK